MPDDLDFNPFNDHAREYFFFDSFIDSVGMGLFGGMALGISRGFKDGLDGRPRNAGFKIAAQSFMAKINRPIVLNALRGAGLGFTLYAWSHAVRLVFEPSSFWMPVALAGPFAWRWISKRSFLPIHRNTALAFTFGLVRAVFSGVCSLFYHFSKVHDGVLHLAYIL